MNKLYVVVLVLFASVYVQAQVVEEVTPSAGRWVTGSAGATQSDPDNLYARIDGKVNKRDISISFHARYIDGGYETLEAASNGEYHGGLGVHVGISDPALGERSWGNGKSYLLWLNVDTRERTKERMPEYYGLRFQVYRSEANNLMRLHEVPALMKKYPDLDSITPENYFSVDIIKGIAMLTGRTLSIEEILMHYSNNPLSFRASYNQESGEVHVYNPVNDEQYFRFTLDPEYMQGNYASLRTNSLAVNFDNITIN